MSSHPFEALSPDLVITAVESTGLISDARILALNSYENRVYQVGVEDSEPVIVKFYRPERWTNKQILEEHEFTLELAELEMPVVPPLIIESLSLLEYEGFRFSIFPRRGGRAPDLDNLDNLLIMGRFMGRLHSVGSSRPFTERLHYSVESFGDKSVSYLLENDFISDNLRPAYQSIAEQLLLRLHDIIKEYQSVSWIRIHGDCHMGNVLWRDETPNFVDFDDTLMGPAIQDLWMLISGERSEKLAQLDELISGYDEFFEFQPKELGLIEALRTLRLMHYSAWLARRWSDPAFPMNFPWFNTENYWASHILELKEQMSALDEPPLTLF